MEKPFVLLHMNKKKVILVMFLYAFLFDIFSMTILIPSNKNLIQLNSLVQSKYKYSAIMNKEISIDEYYVFDASIDFTLFPDSKSCLTADIIMQSEKSIYTDSVYWNTIKLNSFEIAISDNIATANNLHVNDVLYSKNVVTGETNSYHINQIVPCVTRVRKSEGANYNNGIIILGYDKTYAENISHHILIFTDKRIEDIAHTFKDMPHNIVYREDELSYEVASFLPYHLLFVLLASLLIIALVYILNKSIKENFLRLMILGFNKNLLDKSYKSIVYGTCLKSCLCATLLSMCFILALTISHIAMFLLVVTFFISLLVAFFAVYAFNKRLWGR